MILFGKGFFFLTIFFQLILSYFLSSSFDFHDWSVKLIRIDIQIRTSWTKIGKIKLKIPFVYLFIEKKNKSILSSFEINFVNDDDRLHWQKLIEMNFDLWTKINFPSFSKWKSKLHRFFFQPKFISFIWVFHTFFWEKIEWKIIISLKI